MVGDSEEGLRLFLAGFAYPAPMELWSNVKLAGTIVLIICWVVLAFYLRWLSL